MILVIFCMNAKAVGDAKHYFYFFWEKNTRLHHSLGVCVFSFSKYSLYLLKFPKLLKALKSTFLQSMCRFCYLSLLYERFLTYSLCLIKIKSILTHNSRANSSISYFCKRNGYVKNKIPRLLKIKPSKYV